MEYVNKTKTLKLSEVTEEQKIDIIEKSALLVPTRDIAEDYNSSRDTIERVIEFSKFKDPAKLLKGIGILSGAVSSKAYLALNEKLNKHASSLNESMLAGIATFAAQRSQALLSINTPDDIPAWDNSQGFPSEGDVK